MRFLIALVIAIAMVAAAWPYIRQFAPLVRSRDKGPSKPTTRGELIYFAVLVTVVITFVTSTLLWVFGGR